MATLSNSELAQRISDTIDYWMQHFDEFDTWMTGPVGGGDNSDGTYPLTDKNNNTVYFKSPPQLEADVTGLTDSAKTYRDDAQAAASAAATSEANAATSETNAASHESGALTAKSGAETAESGAQNAETNAIAQKQAAQTARDLADQYANEAEDVEVTTGKYSSLHHAAKSAASASAASTSEGNALTYKNEAETARDDAQAAESGAQSAQSAAEAALDSFDDRYLGEKTGDPGLDNDGNALITGALYYNTSSNLMRVYNGTDWEDVAKNTAVSVNYDNSTVPLSAADVQSAIEELGRRPRKNHVINGNFDIWQRGADFSPSTGHTADRWKSNASGGTMNVTQQSFALGQTDVPGEPRYFIRMDATVADDNMGFIHKIEGVRTLAGKQVTLSFWAKSDAARSINISLRQHFGSGGSPSPDTSVGDSVAVTTSWQKFTYTPTLPSLSGKTIGTDGNDRLDILLVNGANETFTLDIAQVQLEEGPVATDFEQRTIGEEWALCLRYFEKEGQNLTRVCRANNSTTAFSSNIPFLVRKRTIPTITVNINGMAGGTAGTMGASRVSENSFRVITSDSSGMTAGDAVSFDIDYEADAEL